MTTTIVKQHKVTGEIVKVVANEKLPRDAKTGVLPHGIFVKVQEATAAGTDYLVIGQEVDGVAVVAEAPVITKSVGYREAFGKAFHKCDMSENATYRTLHNEGGM